MLRHLIAPLCLLLMAAAILFAIRLADVRCPVPAVLVLIGSCVGLFLILDADAEE